MGCPHSLIGLMVAVPALVYVYSVRTGRYFLNESSKAKKQGLCSHEHVENWSMTNRDGETWKDSHCKTCDKFWSEKTGQVKITRRSDTEAWEDFKTTFKTIRKTLKDG